MPSASALDRHIRVMPHLLIAPSKWDTSMRTLELNATDVGRFPRQDPVAGRDVCAVAAARCFKEDPVAVFVLRRTAGLRGA